MASMIVNPTKTSQSATLLSLPAEIRQQIWDLCIPRFKQIETERCFCQEDHTYDYYHKLLNGVSLHRYITKIISVCPFNPLLYLNHQTRDEVLQLRQLGFPLHFPYDRCFVDFLARLTKEEMELVHTVWLMIILRWEADLAIWYPSYYEWLNGFVAQERDILVRFYRPILGEYFEDLEFGDVETEQINKELSTLKLQIRTSSPVFTA